MSQETPLAHGEVSFETEGRLLQELGERLVASPEVALVELIKNAYDADATVCQIVVSSGGESVEVRDNGHGMSFDQFTARWMRIATSHKLEEQHSPKFLRKRTGQKGIGRFAVRYLGSQLTLATTSWDEGRGSKTRLEATFNWPAIDGSKDLRSAPIPFRLFQVTADTVAGTTLRIDGLKREPGFIASKDFRTGVLKIVSPIQSLKSGRFGKKGVDEDDTFRVVLPGQNEADVDVDLATEVLGRAWAQLSIDLRRGSVTYGVRLASTGKVRELTVKLRSKISSGLVADIRFFPRRSGVFRAAPFDGRRGWDWVKDNRGIAVVDHGFRIKPYGFEQDDWLSLDYDAAHNEREWRTEIAKEHFPIPPEIKSQPGENPALNLPSNFQVVGAVFLESAPTSVSGDAVDLTPSMDRQGYLENDAFKQLQTIVRAGVEFLAVVDKKDLQRTQELMARRKAAAVREDFKAAVEWIAASETLTRSDKTRLVEHYADLAQKVEEVEEYDKEARRKLETMSLLGVVAGFMTHESARILQGLEQAIDRLRSLGGTDKKLKEALDQVESGYSAFKEQIDYTSTFVESMHNDRRAPFLVGPQIKRLIKKFGSFAEARGIAVALEVPSDLKSPAVPVTLYSGVLLNLYTNALKGILSREHAGSSDRIVFRGWETQQLHFVEVLDTGIGVPPHLRKRVFDPLFTTTSRVSNPLGSGMGLGLSLVKELLRQVNGDVAVVDPPSGFSTCFRVTLPKE